MSIFARWNSFSAFLELKFRGIFLLLSSPRCSFSFYILPSLDPMIQSFHCFCSSSPSLWILPFQQVWKNPNINCTSCTYKAKHCISAPVSSSLLQSWQSSDRLTILHVLLLCSQEPPQVYLVIQINILPRISFLLLILIHSMSTTSM